ncbi:hypothetical protein [Cystobacter ferrugineus]|uniref:hypothetical protein n=1 Tax=Cystobacter ferrugineus TaxID=83449 RepID=UPI0011614C6D|nr:hypothetical protein [Cystobacter ferrugineus]
MFSLRAGTPACLTVHDAEDSTISDAMQTVFPLETCSTLDWGGIEISLSYKYDLSMMADDIAQMIVALQASPSGTFQVDWPSSGFPYHWTLKWDPSIVEIHAIARPEPGAEDLTGRESVQTRKSSFVAGWQEVLRTIVSCLEASGYKDAQIAGLASLRQAAGRSATAPA